MQQKTFQLGNNNDMMEADKYRQQEYMKMNNSFDCQIDDSMSSRKSKYSGLKQQVGRNI